MSLQANKGVHLTLNHTRPPGKNEVTTRGMLHRHIASACHRGQRHPPGDLTCHPGRLAACWGRIQDVQGSNIPHASSGGSGQGHGSPGGGLNPDSEGKGCEEEGNVQVSNWQQNWCW